MKTPTDTASTAAIQNATRELRLPGIREQHTRLADQAERTGATYLGFLADALTLEVDDRAERRRARRITEAKFPRPKRLADFDLDAAPTVNAATIATLAAGNYLDNGDPVVLLGDSGTGKTHLLIGLGMAACEQGRRVRYTTCAQLTNELNEAADERRLAKLIAKYSRVELLIVDELGYVKLDARGAELFFQVLTDRDEKSTIAVGSNLPFSQLNGAKSSKTPGSSPPSSTGSRSTPTSSKPAPTPTDSKPAAPRHQQMGPNKTSTVGPIRVDIPTRRLV